MKLKKISLAVISAVASIGVILSSFTSLNAIAGESPKQIYNAYSEFSLSDASDSVWNFQYRTAGNSGYLYTDLTVSGNNWGDTAIGTITTVKTDNVTGNPALYFNPSNQDINKELVLNFIAPYSGTIKVEMANGGVFATRNSIGLVNFKMLHNENNVKSISNLDSTYGKNNPFFDDAQAVTVKAGDAIRFVVGRNASNGRAFTYFNPQITYVDVVDDKVKEEYNAADDFTTQNGGRWKYYNRNITTGVYTPLALNSSGSWGPLGNGSIAKANDPVTGKPALTLHSGLGVDAALAFVAPYSGTLELSMANGGIVAPESGYDGINFSLYHNDTLNFSSHVNSANNYEGHRIFDDKKTFTVKAGDIFYFVVNANNNTTKDSTYLNPYFKYTNITDTDNSLLRFLDEDKIESSNLYKDSFDISWPSARGGIADYTYTVYLSETPITGIPESGGIEVGAVRSHTFTGLKNGTSYYVAVVASDGLSTALLYNEEPVNTIGKMFVFNANDDYSKEVMKSPWSYRYAKTGTTDFKDLAWTNGMWGDSASVGSITAVTSDLVTGKPALCLTPAFGNSLAIIFTAPYTGTINLSLVNGGIFVPYSGESDGFDGINFKLSQNDKELIEFDAVNSKNCHPSSVGSMYVGRVFDDEKTISVKAGDKLIFAVDANKVVGNDPTFLNPEIIYTSVAEGALDLHFEEGKLIEGSLITDSSFTANLPSVYGGTGNYSYKLYVSDKPITQIPDEGGIDLGAKTSYSLDKLNPYTNYYVAATVFDGEKTASIINSKPISTIGNTYEFVASKDYTTKEQPINSPWRYYADNSNTDERIELYWNEATAQFEAGGIAPSILLNKAESDLVTGKTALCVHPDLRYELIVAFIAPYSGKITIDSANGGVFVPINGQAVNYDGINFTVLKNKDIIYSKNAVSALNNQSDRCFATGISTTVKRGDILYFKVNCNTAAASDMTFFDPRVEYTYVEKGSDKFDFMPGAKVMVTDVKETSFKLNWSNAFSPLDGDIKYDAYISESPIKTKPNTGKVYSGTKLSVNCKGLKIGRRYYVYIVATDPSGAKAVLNPAEPVLTATPTYNAHSDFKTTNGAGIWNYANRNFDGVTNTYKYTLLSYSEDSKEFGNTSDGLVRTADSDAVTGKPALMLHPGIGGNAATLVFTAPYSGEVSISLANGAVFCPNNGSDQDYDGISFTVLKGQKQLFKSDNVSANNNIADKYVFNSTIKAKITQGEKLYFIVDANANNSADVTYFNPYIKYNYVSGGSGKVTLSGFVSPVETETEIVDSVHIDDKSFRDNKSVAAQTVSGEKFAESEDGINIIQIILIGLLAFVVVGGVFILILNSKHNKK